MTIDDIKTPSDVYQFIDEHISYGWVGFDNEVHQKTLNGIHTLYRTSPIDEILSTNMGICIEQVYLMKYLLAKIGIDASMYCIKLNKSDYLIVSNELVQLHCFLLYEYNGKIYQMEHPNFMCKGIHEFKSYESAIRSLVSMYAKSFYLNLVFNTDLSTKMDVHKYLYGNPDAMSVIAYDEVPPYLDFDGFVNYLDEVRLKKLDIKSLAKVD